MHITKGFLYSEFFLREQWKRPRKSRDVYIKENFILTTIRFFSIHLHNVMKFRVITELFRIIFHQIYHYNLKTSSDLKRHEFLN